MNEDIDNLERELTSLRPAQPSTALRQRVGAAIASAPSPRSGGEDWGEGADHPATSAHAALRAPALPQPLASTHLARRRFALAAGLAIAASIALAVFLGRGGPTESQPQRPAPKGIAIGPVIEPAPLSSADAAPYSWLACHRAAAVSEEALAALLDEQARRMPALAGGMLTLRADLSRPN